MHNHWKVKYVTLPHLDLWCECAVSAAQDVFESVLPNVQAMSSPLSLPPPLYFSIKAPSGPKIISLKQYIFGPMLKPFRAKPRKEMHRHNQKNWPFNITRVKGWDWCVVSRCCTLYEAGILYILLFSLHFQTASMLSSTFVKYCKQLYVVVIGYIAFVFDLLFFSVLVFVLGR